MYTPVLLGGLLVALLLLGTMVRERLTNPPPEQPPESTPEQPPPAPTQATPSNFGQAIELYRTNYVQYRATGRSEFKVAYEVAQAWIEDYLRRMDAKIAADGQAISEFVTKYATANPDLTALQRQFQTIRREGPALENTYATVKRINDEQPEIDLTDLYVKAGVATALLGITLVMSG